jgi:hypothetical protein
MAPMAGTSMRQHTTPLFLDSIELSGTARALDRVPFASKEQDETWLQRLIYRFPQLLPVREIEPAFGSLISVCVELPTQVGRIDNLYVTETGNLALAECKLWKNPEARRQVLAQVIDYAHSIANWTYENLESAIRSGNRLDDGKITGGLFSLVSENADLEEQSFIDVVTRNLRLGRVLLLLVGDGIREGVETLTEYLQLHAGFHFTLAIVEIATFKLPTQGFIIQPRVLARTVNIERGIVRLGDDRITMELSRKPLSAQPTSISLDQLLETLEKVAPDVPPALAHFQEEAKELGIFVEPASKSLQIRWRGRDDVDYALANITTEGQLRTMRVNFKPDRIGRVDLAHEYLAKIAALIGSKVRQTRDPKGWYVEGTKNRLPDAMDLLSRSSEWVDIIRWYASELDSALEVTPE